MARCASAWLGVAWRGASTGHVPLTSPLSGRRRTSNKSELRDSLSLFLAFVIIKALRGVRGRGLASRKALPPLVNDTMRHDRRTSLLLPESLRVSQTHLRSYVIATGVCLSFSLRLPSFHACLFVSLLHLLLFSPRLLSSFPSSLPLANRAAHSCSGNLTCNRVWRRRVLYSPEFPDSAHREMLIVQPIAYYPYRCFPYRLYRDKYWDLYIYIDSSPSLYFSSRKSSWRNWVTP